MQRVSLIVAGAYADEMMLSVTECLLGEWYEPEPDTFLINPICAVGSEGERN